SKARRDTDSRATTDRARVAEDHRRRHRLRHVVRAAAHLPPGPTPVLARDRGRAADPLARHLPAAATRGDPGPARDVGRATARPDREALARASPSAAAHAGARDRPPRSSWAYGARRRGARRAVAAAELGAAPPHLTAASPSDR